MTEITPTPSSSHPVRIVFVHGMGGTPGTFALVEPYLRSRGHRTLRVTNPLTSLADDVRTTTAAVEEIADGGRVLLVGHSYGGAVITNAGRHPAVASLVYVAAFAPAERETVNEIVERYPAAAVSRYMTRGENGDWVSERTEEYWNDIAFDLPRELRETIASERRRSENAIFVEPTGDPAWRTCAATYVVAEEDRTLHPDAQRDMAKRAGAAIYTFPGSHYTPWTQPQQVAGIVAAAADASAEA